MNWEWFDLSDHQGNIHVGSMGHATVVGCGMAIALPHRRVIVLDADGGALLDLAALVLAGPYRPDNLKVFVFDNEPYSGSTISEPTATAIHTDLARMAQGAGIVNAVKTSEWGAFESGALKARSTSGVSYIVSKVVTDTSSRRLSKLNVDYMENMYRFVRYIERTEHMEILLGLRRPLAAGPRREQN